MFLMDSLTSDIEFCVEERKGLSQVVFSELVSKLLNCSGKIFISRLLELEAVVKTWSDQESDSPDELEPNGGEEELKPEIDHCQELVPESSDQSAITESTSSVMVDDSFIVPGPISKRLLPKSVKLALNTLSRHKNLLKCMVCNQNFPTSKSLRLHIAENHIGKWRHHDRDESLKLRIPSAGRRSVGRPANSTVCSAPSRPSASTCYICMTCGKEVTTAGSLKRHMIDIHGEDKRQYTCEMCGVSLTSASSLNRHKVQLHLNCRKHACGECGREFALRQTLVQHINGVHLKYRPHLCPLCGDRFLKRDNLRNHTRLVHREKFNQQ